ncbi:uncharacterized protein LOC144914939 [Branchiostoma floridae x Branchiostoma belcheri]
MKFMIGMGTGGGATRWCTGVVLQLVQSKFQRLILFFAGLTLKKGLKEMAIRNSDLVQPHLLEHLMELCPGDGPHLPSKLLLDCTSTDHLPDALHLTHPFPGRALPDIRHQRSQTGQV